METQIRENTTKNMDLMHSHRVERACVYRFDVCALFIALCIKYLSGLDMNVIIGIIESKGWRWVTQSLMSTQIKRRYIDFECTTSAIMHW
ncbi:hypothetical protein AB7140_09660 [Providencia rettgeri]|uniref:hypothetical protein n=1 Tax=Providencia sp. PROV160 TaxID=2949869 RepID=UPI0023490EB4|nr:hypothetical protein [Providencia sp. PROV160]